MSGVSQNFEQLFTNEINRERIGTAALVAFGIAQVIGITLLVRSYNESKKLTCDKDGQYDEGCDARDREFRWGLFLSWPTVILIALIYVLSVVNAGARNPAALPSPV